MIRSAAAVLMVLALSAACLSAGDARAGECVLDSPRHRVAVLELYTSEGCSSCPPADRWFSGLRRGGLASESAVLLAFHVDYWNRLGWPDPFSQPAFSARQRAAAARASRGIVYTPQVLLNGVDYRQSGGEGVRERLAAINARPAGARIQARVQYEGKALRVTGTVQAAAGSRARAWVAMFENGLFTEVRAGENAGKRLAHDFVVREMVGPLALDLRGMAAIDHRLPLPSAATVERLGVAVFVEQADTGDVLQATSLYPLCS